MIQIAIETSGLAQAREGFRHAREQMLTAWEQTMNRHAFKAVRIIQERYRGAATTTPTATRVGTGALRASYSQRTARATTDSVESTIGLMRISAHGRALAYGAVHEEGATITPTRGRYLAIPLPTIRSPAGIAPPPRSFTGTFIIQGKRGPVIMRRTGTGAAEPIFALRESVTIPARPPGGAVNMAVKEIQSQLEADLQQNAVDAIGGGTAGTA